MKKMTKKIWAIGIVAILLCGVGLVLATEHNLNVPYHEQEQWNWCGPASAEMLIDYYTSDESQADLWDYIQDHNVEGELWHTDPQGLEDCVEHYVENAYPDYYASDKKSSNPDTRIRSQTWDIAEWNDPSASLTLDGDHWMVVKGAKYKLEGDHVKEVYGFWIHDPDDYLSPPDNKYLSIDSWKSQYFTQVDVSGSRWNNYWVTVEGDWSGRLSKYSEKVNAIEIMGEEEDSIVIDENTDFADFALEEMRKLNLFPDALEGAIPGEPILIHWIGEGNYSDYYLIPFEKGGRIAVIATVFIEDGIADFGGCGAPSGNITELMKPTMEEAREVLKANGYKGEWEGRAVMMVCEQPICPRCWEFRNEKGETAYVGFDRYANQTKVYDELTPKKKGG